MSQMLHNSRQTAYGFLKNLFASEQRTVSDIGRTIIPPWELGRSTIG
jgi:hypothetical protein